jgi:hypothetical protein
VVLIPLGTRNCAWRKIRRRSLVCRWCGRVVRICRTQLEVESTQALLVIAFSSLLLRSFSVRRLLGRCTGETERSVPQHQGCLGSCLILPFLCAYQAEIAYLERRNRSRQGLPTSLLVRKMRRRFRRCRSGGGRICNGIKP